MQSEQVQTWCLHFLTQIHRALQDKAYLATLSLTPADVRFFLKGGNAAIMTLSPVSLPLPLDSDFDAMILLNPRLPQQVYDNARVELLRQCARLLAFTQQHEWAGVKSALLESGRVLIDSEPGAQSTNRGALRDAPFFFRFYENYAYTNEKGKLVHLNISILKVFAMTKQKYELMDITIPHKSYGQLEYEWATEDPELFALGDIEVPISNPLTLYVDQVASATPSTEPNPNKRTRRLARAQRLKNNVLRPHALNFAHNVGALASSPFELYGRRVSNIVGNLLPPLTPMNRNTTRMNEPSNIRRLENTYNKAYKRQQKKELTQTRKVLKNAYAPAPSPAPAPSLSPAPIDEELPRAGAGNRHHPMNTRPSKKNAKRKAKEEEARKEAEEAALLEAGRAQANTEREAMKLAHRERLLKLEESARARIEKSAEVRRMETLRAMEHHLVPASSNIGKRFVNTVRGKSNVSETNIAKILGIDPSKVTRIPGLFTMDNVESPSSVLAAAGVVPQNSIEDVFVRVGVPPKLYEPLIYDLQRRIDAMVRKRRQELDADPKNPLKQKIFAQAFALSAFVFKQPPVVFNSAIEMAAKLDNDPEGALAELLDDREVILENPHTSVLQLVVMEANITVALRVMDKKKELLAREKALSDALL